MKRFACIALCLTIVISMILLSCTTAQPASRTIFAMDTVMTLTVYGVDAEDALSDAVQRIFALEELLSVTKETSEIARLNAANGESVVLSPEVYALLLRAQDYTAQFDGHFDITIAPIVALWGFYTDEFAVPDDESLAETLSRVNAANLVLQDGTAQLLNNAQIDLGGIAKGYAAELVADVLRQYEIDGAVLDLGGNVMTIGARGTNMPWRVAVRDPRDASRQLCVLEVGEQALVTSGADQRYFEVDSVRYHHIIDPATGYPAASDLYSVTVITPDPTYADALSTALFVMGFADAVTYWRDVGDFEAVFVLTDGSVQLTSGAAELQSKKNNAFKIIM